MASVDYQNGYADAKATYVDRMEEVTMKHELDQKCIIRLKAALQKIVEHPHISLSEAMCVGMHCDDNKYDAWRIVGCVQGHRCAAQIAQEALEAKDG